MPGVLTRLAACAAIIAVVLLCQPRRDVPDVTVSAGLNLREAPDVRSKRMAVLPPGSTVEIDTCLADRSWCRVRHGSSSGWTSARYLNVMTGTGAVRVSSSDNEALQLQVEPGSASH